MLFNPEVLFSTKKTRPNSSNDKPQQNSNERVPYKKHLDFILNAKLNCKQHTDSAISKVNKGIAIIKTPDITFHKNR